MLREDINNIIGDNKICIIIPVYNSEKIINNVLDDCISCFDNIIVVNDGSTDGTGEVLSRYRDIIKIESYEKNRGKGYALKRGFLFARQLGYEYAVTIDADGQHKVDDLPLFISAVRENKDSMVIGCRDFSNPNMPKQNKFANRFSNFWFCLQTFKKLPDTQTGYRLYPLNKLRHFKSLSNRYEAELEMLVRAAWANIHLKPVFINVYYPPQEERLSHFDSRKDFIKISLLNTVLCFMAIIYGYPSMLIRKIFSKIFVKN